MPPIHDYIDGLFIAHWTTERFKQRMREEDWANFMLQNPDGDKILAQGQFRQLKVRDIGYGVVEISKEPLVLAQG